MAGRTSPLALTMVHATLARYGHEDPSQRLRTSTLSAVVMLGMSARRVRAGTSADFNSRSHVENGWQALTETPRGVLRLEGFQLEFDLLFACIRRSACASLTLELRQLLLALVDEPVDTESMMGEKAARLYHTVETYSAISACTASRSSGSPPRSSTALLKNSALSTVARPRQ